MSRLIDLPETIRVEEVAADGARLRRCIEMAMGCIDPLSKNPDERLAWHRLSDAMCGREPRAALTSGQTHD